MSRSFWSISLSSGATLRGKTLVVFGQRTAGERDDLLAQRAHFDHFVIELRELLVKFVSHQPNLPVM